MKLLYYIQDHINVKYVLSTSGISGTYFAIDSLAGLESGLRIVVALVTLYFLIRNGKKVEPKKDIPKEDN